MTDIPEADAHDKLCIGPNGAGRPGRMTDPSPAKGYAEMVVTVRVCAGARCMGWVPNSDGVRSTKVVQSIENCSGVIWRGTDGRFDPDLAWVFTPNDPHTVIVSAATIGTWTGYEVLPGGHCAFLPK